LRFTFHAGLKCVVIKVLDENGDVLAVIEIPQQLLGWQGISN